MTPGQAAKKWAKEHPEFTGILLVISHTRKGRGGWGQTTRTNKFFVRDGKSAQRRDAPGRQGFNGVCWACGQIYLKTVLRWAVGPDPQAGEPVPDDELWQSYKGESFVYHEYAQLRACPKCVEEHNLTITFLGLGPVWACPTWARIHPLADGMPVDTNVPHEMLDLR